MQYPAHLVRRTKSLYPPMLALLIVALVPQSASFGDAKTDKVVVASANEILGKWIGTWDVKAIRRQPMPGSSEYRETFEWRLNDRFLYGETTRNAEGSKSISMATFDANAQAYRFWFFDSNGFAIELPIGTWDQSTQTMLVETGFFNPVRYTGSVKFVNPDKIVWSAVLKDWKGTIALHLEGVSTRSSK
jgi:hypothetical protein